MITWAALSGESPAHRRRSLGIRWLNSGQEAVGAYAEVLCDSDEARYPHGKETTLDSAQGLPMNADKLRQAFLCQTGVESRLLDVLADTTEHWTINHIQLRAIIGHFLTPRICSAKVWALCLNEDSVKTMRGRAKAGTIALKSWKWPTGISQESVSTLRMKRFRRCRQARALGRKSGSSGFRAKC